jgi:short-subunit dehydrogenase
MYFAVDLSEKDAAKKIFDWCNTNNYSVHILVNNAAFGLCGFIEQYSLDAHLEMMHVNTTAPLQLIYLFLPHLKQQREAYIMNISSCAAYQAVPGLNIYSASKSFILNFSRGLKYELKNTNVSVTVISPGATDTDFLNRANIKSARALKISKTFNMSPQKVASIAVKGMFAKKAEVITGFINRFNTFLVWLLPKSLVEKSAAHIYDVG